MSMSSLSKIIYKRRSHGKKLNTYLINSKLWKSLKIKTMNFENLKINRITFSTLWAPNKVFKQQICIRNVFSPWKQLTLMTID
jgi:hypothetical protein